MECLESGLLSCPSPTPWPDWRCLTWRLHCSGVSLAGCRWPVDPLKSGLLKALGDLGMPRFTRRYPRLCDSIVKQVVEMAHVRP